MANSNEKKQEKHDKPEEMHSKQAISTTKKPAKSYLAILSLLVAVIAIATAIYTIMLNQQLHQNFNAQKDQIASRLNELEHQQASIESNINNAGQTLKNTEKELQDRLKSLHQQFKLTMQQRQYENQDWMLLKARYYLELAQINAHWSDSNKTTIALLNQADLILANTSTRDVFKIRQAIAKEIALINASPKIDTAGLLSKLDAINQTIGKLPISSLAASKPENTLQADNKTKNANPRAWRERLQDSVNMLEKLVVIRHHDQDIKPLLSPLYVAVIRENIRINIQEAQWAILKRNNEIYQIAMTQAIKNIKRNFDLKATTTSALLEQLNQLKELDLNQPKPEITLSLPMINQLITTKIPADESGQTSGSKGDPSQ